MRILHVVTTIELGGAEKQLLLLTREQVASGHEVYVMPLKGELTLEPLFTKYGIKIQDKQVNQSFIRQLSAIWKFVKVKELDILHSHLPRAELLGALAIFGIPFKNFIVTKHNSEKFYPRGSALISKKLARLVHKRAKHIICISNTVREYLVSIGELTLRHNTQVIYYGVDSRCAAEYNPRLRKLTKTNNFMDADSKGIELVTISRLVPQKNLETLIEAVRILRYERMIPVRLSIYGAGSLEQDLRNKLNSARLVGVVTLQGKVKNINEILPNYDVFVLVSLYEGFGLAALEALQLGLKTVISDRGALLEVFGKEYPFKANPLDPRAVADIIQLTQRAPASLAAVWRSQILSAFDIKSTSEATLRVYEKYEKV